MTELFYTEQRLNADEEQALDLRDFQGNRYIAPMDYMAIASIPGPIGSRTLPPQGPYATPIDLNYQNEALEFGRRALPNPVVEHSENLRQPKRSGDPLAVHALSLERPSHPLARDPTGLDPGALSLHLVPRMGMAKHPAEEALYEADDLRYRAQNDLPGSKAMVTPMTFQSGSMLPYLVAGAAALYFLAVPV